MERLAIAVVIQLHIGLPPSLMSPGRRAEAQLHEHWDSITSQHCLPRPCDSQHVPLGTTMPRAQSV